MVPASTNDGNVIVLNPLPKFMLLASETNVPVPASIKKLKKELGLLWPVTAIESSSPDTEAKLNVAVSPAVYAVTGIDSALGDA